MTPSGGYRPGSGRPKKDNSIKAKNHTFKLYDWEVEKVKLFIKHLRFKDTIKKDED